LKTSDFTYLLNNTDTISDRQVSDLEFVLSEFPYFQSVAVIRLKGLYNQNDFRYNSELKKIASQVTNRTVLYDLVMAKKKSYNFFNEKDLYDIEVVEPEVVLYKSISTEEKHKQSVMFSIETSQIKDIEFEHKNQSIQSNETDSEKLEHSILFSIETSQIKNLSDNKETDSQLHEKSKPTSVSSSDKFSFTQWLLLTQKQLIVKTDEIEKRPKTISQKQKKIEIIDKFIEANPKIIPGQNESTKLVLDEKNIGNPTLMTETLAEVYLKQKKYQKAIEAYEILILKYPKKSSFFADRINAIKKIQQNNI